MNTLPDRDMRTTTAAGTVRSFAFGRLTLEAKRCEADFGDGRIIVLAVQEGAITIVCDDDGGRRLDARHCALLVGAGAVQLRREGEGPARILWCAGERIAARRWLVDERGLRHQMKLTEQIETLLSLGVKTDVDHHDACLREAVGSAVFNACRDLLEDRRDPVFPTSIRRFRDHVDRHFADPCTLTSLAAIAGVTREHLNATFRRSVGVTPMRYVWMVRTRKAVRLVESTGLNLSTIAEQCGYKSPFHLSREIKRMTGRTPREIRRSPEEPGPVEARALP